VDFQAMSTNLSRAEPLVMPWNNDIYFFKPDEFRKLFGDDVVKEMEGNPPPLPSAPAERRDREVPASARAAHGRSSADRCESLR
jgi:hypothetical protein